jgi:hypothetical protein
MDKVLKNAKTGLYIYIFISPELASILTFQNQLKDTKFKK